MAAALVPSFASGLMFNWAADVVALVALLGAARALLALAGMDVGTSFGGIGSSREMMIATLAEPAMMLIVLTLAIAAGTTRLAGVADFFIAEPFAVRVSLALSLVALVIVALAENARIPVDNPVDPSRAHHGPRGHGPGIFRTPPRPDRGGELPQAGALPVAADLPVRALRHGAGERGLSAAG